MRSFYTIVSSHLRILSVIASMLFLFVCQGQSDTLGRYSPGFKFNDGLYLSFEDFKSNCPAIPATRVLDSRGETLVDIGAASSFFAMRNDSLLQVLVEDIFGYSYQGQVSLQHNGNFDRLIVIGTLCHVVHREIVVDYGRGGLYEYNNIPVRREVQMEFLMDMRSGDKLLFEPKNLDYHIADDPSLAKEYGNKSRKQRRNAMYSILHAYNRKNPVYFSISRCR